MQINYLHINNYHGEKAILNTQNLKLLNQPSKKFRSHYIGPYKIINEISSQAYKLDLPNVT